ncbi:MAG: beta-N-acetylhexosaminidase [Opitutales bacterium]|nr:beta-N-acetylhexosaminidase [Opitutales bacterium]
MKNKWILFWIAGIFFAGTLFAAAAKEKKSGGNELPIIPVPVKVEQKSGKYTLRADTKIVAKEVEAKAVAKVFADDIYRVTGWRLQVVPAGTGIVLRLDKRAKTGAEGYELDVSSSGVRITAEKPAGLFYGLQTLRQLMPAEIYSTKIVKDKVWSVPAVKIKDEPRFGWRGAHVDTARHFYSKEEILKFIDAMAWHKLNKFHWHFTEDQAWRVEIKKYPLLTKKGAWRSDILTRETGKRFDSKKITNHWQKGLYGGYYSQKDIKEVVKYAQERFVEIVPEIEIPGHSSAALYAYPEYSCDGKAPGWPILGGGVFGKIYCAGKDSTLNFLKDIFSELCDLFPGGYVHIGGDEAPKGAWKNCPDCQRRIKKEGLKDEEELQSWMISQMQKYLESRGKKIIGWDEITEGGIPKGCTVMHWREYTDKKIAPLAGEDLIVATRPTCYYNWGYAKEDQSFLLSQGGIMPIKQAYDFEPIPRGLDEKYHKHIIGAQACFWGEKTPNEKILEYHYFPRMSCISECTWSPTARKNWQNFEKRLQMQEKRYKAADINARPLVLPADYKPY